MNVEQIQLTVSTGNEDLDFNHRVFLGFLGSHGREFRCKIIDGEVNPFRANQTITITFGTGSNAENPNLNDPRNPQLDIVGLEKAYIRIDPNARNRWSLNDIKVFINGSLSYQLKIPNIVLDEDSSEIIFLDNVLQSQDIEILSVEPKINGNIVCLPVIRNHEKGEDGVQVALKIKIKNNSNNMFGLDKVIVSFEGSPIVDPVVYDFFGKKRVPVPIGDDPPGTVLVNDQEYQDVFSPDILKIEPQRETPWLHLQYHEETGTKLYHYIKLPHPSPSHIRISLKFKNSLIVPSIVKKLVFHDHPTPNGSYLYWGKKSDMGKGEYWVGQTRRGHDYDQRYAYDVGIVKYDNDANDWLESPSNITDPSNEDYYVFGKPVYAIAEGIVHRSRDSQEDHPPGGTGGNNFIEIIVNNRELVSYSHLKQGSIPSHLKSIGSDTPPPNTRVNLGEKVGEVGNSGNSSHPHLHIQVLKFPSLHLLPLKIYGAKITRGIQNEPIPEPAVTLNGGGLPWLEPNIFNLHIPEN